MQTLQLPNIFQACMYILVKQTYRNGRKRAVKTLLQWEFIDIANGMNEPHVFQETLMNMEATTHKRKRDEFTDVDPTICIICQTVTNEEVKSFPDGRRRIIDASVITQDDVTERLRIIDLENVVYHVTNNCYKRYTHKTLLQKLQSTPLKEILNVDQKDLKSEGNRQSRFKHISRPVPNVFVPNVKSICIVCGQIKCKGDVIKYRISECERARKFLAATVYFQDSVYVRTCDLQDEHAVFGADIYYHKNCLRSYLKRYEEEKTPRKRMNTKRDIFLSVVTEIEPTLLHGNGVSLSELRLKANSKLSTTEVKFTNREMKILLTDRYGLNLCIVESLGNQSTLVYLNGSSNEDITDISEKLDPVVECAKMIRECLLTTDFNLGDKFCDASDLKESWEQTAIPDPLLRFFGVLLNFDSTHFNENQEGMNKQETCVDSVQCVDVNCEEDCEDDEGEDNEADEDDIENKSSNKKYVSKNKKRKVQALHQIMYYNVHNGRKKTPLHVMNSQVIHEKCKSKDIITSFNHYGLAISYTELQKFHNDMGSYIVASSTGKVPLPSQLDTEMFTIGAFDNFDHNEATLSGLGGSHDTVSVLFQDMPPEVHRKPNVSDTNIERKSRIFTKQLPSQEILEYTKPVRRPTLPTSFTVSDDMFDRDEKKDSLIRTKDTAWTITRLELANIDEGSIQIDCKHQTMPSWGAFNSVVTSETLCEKIVGFLPVIPHPVTEFSTVYTALKNFQDILGQLKQTRIAITCDEGVYHIAREIKMATGEEFSDIVLCLGSFHMAKIFLGCLGKYVRNSGAESIWTENGVFGQQVVQCVLAGTHYARAVKGHMLLSEAMERLQWSEFFKENGVHAYQYQLKILQELKQAVSGKDLDESKKKLAEFQVSSQELMKHFESFKTEQRQKSETFRYWDTYIQLVRLLKNLTRADREGDWSLHLSTVQMILPIFAVFDSVNYLRWCSLYFEDMRKLPETAPEIYQQFMEGKFVVKRTPGKFKAVAADQALEQTINRSQKTSGGIIGNTRRKEYVALWEIIYHEMIEISAVHREVGGSKSYYHELTVSHEFSQSETKAREANINDMTAYIEIYDNPFHIDESTEKKLHNVITQEVMTQEIRDSILEVERKGTGLYKDFRKERFVEKSKRLTDTIHRNNIKTFQSINSTLKQSSVSKKKKRNYAGAGHRLIEIAQARGSDTKELFRYDLASENYLFDEEGFMKKTNKSVLCHELEKTIDKGNVQTLTHSDMLPTVYLVDVMANLRKTNLKGLKTFGDFCAAFVQMISHICKNASQIDFVFDSYVDGSVKDSERIRRGSIMPVELNIVNEDTPLPVNIATFWLSNANKTKLELLLRTWIKDNSTYIFPDIVILLSGMKCNDTIVSGERVKEGKSEEYLHLEFPIEEADVRLIPHAIYASEAGIRQIIVLSSDTDVMVLLLYFWNELNSHGLEKLWVRAGVGDSTRYIPLHAIAVKNEALCKVLPAAHILTGCDTTSKVGTKLGALKANPEKYLVEFGTDLNTLNKDDVIKKAEEYLVQVIKYNSPCKTMDELRYTVYHHSKGIDIQSLPPTSYAIRQHILRCWYSTFVQIQCMTKFLPNPKDYGYEECDDLLLPTNLTLKCPETLVIACHCKSCSTKRCVCRKAGIRCCVFCKCEENPHQLNICVNPNIVLSVPIVL